VASGHDVARRMPPSTPSEQAVTLRRALSLRAVTLYGLGTTIGAGIYALTGKVAGGAGMFAPVAFLVASLLAAFTAFSFGELSSRFPRSAGEATYVREAFRVPALAAAVGLLVVLSGSVSAATISNGFVGYAQELVELPRALLILGIVALLALVAAWGVRESVFVANTVTVIEIVGLLLVVWMARDALGDLPARLPELGPPADLDVWRSIFAASLLAFYAFLGFEDMVNVAEEVKDVRRVLPLAIVVTLVLTSLVYVVLAVTAILAVSPAELAESDAPLSLIWERATGRAPVLISVVGVVAMINGALIQVIMASRILYGLASQGLAPAALGRVHPRTRTPLLATGLVSLLIALLALWLPLARLARTTSVLTLSVFAIVNLALVWVKRREPRPEGIWLIPGWVPVVGFVVSVLFLGIEALRLVGF
jgi:amino acid transporter